MLKTTVEGHGRVSLQPSLCIQQVESIADDENGGTSPTAGALVPSMIVERNHFCRFFLANCWTTPSECCCSRIGLEVFYYSGYLGNPFPKPYYKSL